MSLGFTPLGDRIVIKADIEDHAPQETASGLLLASSMAAAVDGSDTEDSWFVGTIVAIGPLVNHFDCRKFVLRKLRGLFPALRVDESHICAEIEDEIIPAIEALPTDCPDPLNVGDRVTFSWASGQQMTLDGEKFLIMKASEVLAVLDPDV